MVIGHDGLIVAVGPDSEIAAQYDTPKPASATAAGNGDAASKNALTTPNTPALGPSHSYLYEVDASGTCILPGLVDGHTHPVWAGDRVHEFKMKLAGATYMDIHKVSSPARTHARTLADPLRERDPRDAPLIPSPRVPRLGVPALSFPFLSDRRRHRLHRSAHACRE